MGGCAVCIALNPGVVGVEVVVVDSSSEVELQYLSRISPK